MPSYTHFTHCGVLPALITNPHHRPLHPKWFIVAVASIIGSAACNDNTSGDASLAVLIEAEDVIINGLEPGNDIENVRDGWAVTFDKYLVTVGDIDIHFAIDETITGTAPTLWTLDLTQVPTAGVPLWSLDGLAAGRWQFFYTTAAPRLAHAKRHDSVNTADYSRMLSQHWNYLISGSLQQSGGRSCPPTTLAQPPAGAQLVAQNRGGDACYANANVHFVIAADAPAHFGPCDIDGTPGFALAAGGTQTVSATIHGDHIFFNGFPETSEGGVGRLAQWLADCDLNIDGEVTSDELKHIIPSDLPELDDRFQLGGSPITPLNNMWTYLRAQLSTQGHFQGEGECPVDGSEHHHE